MKNARLGIILAVLALEQNKFPKLFATFAIAVLLASGLGSCTHTSAPLSAASTLNAIDTAHFRSGIVIVHGITIEDTFSYSYDQTLPYENEHGGDLQSNTIERHESISNSSTHMKNDSILFQTANFFPGIFPGTAVLFVKDSVTQTFTSIHVNYFNSWGADSGPSGDTIITYDLFNIPFTMNSDGSAKAHVLLTSSTPHLDNYSYQDGYDDGASAGDVDTRTIQFIKVDSVSADAFIDIQLNP
jgi:hypothetical protein